MTPKSFVLSAVITPLLAAVLAATTMQAHALVGIDWSLSNLSPTSESLNGVARDGDVLGAASRFKVVGSNGLILSATSAVGPFVAEVTGTRENLNAIAWSATSNAGQIAPFSKFVAVGNNGTILTSTKTGTPGTYGAWTSVGDASMKGMDFVSVYWTSARFLVGGNSAAGPVVYGSTDGITWTKYASLSGAGLKLKSVCGTRSSLVTVVTDKNVQTHSATTATGAWSVTLFPSPELAVQSILYPLSPELFLISASSAYTASTVGGTWTKRSTLTDGQLNLTLNYSLTGQTILGAGANGKVWTSVAGSTWTSLGQVEAGLNLHGAVDFGGDVVAVGDAGRIYRYHSGTWASVYSTGAIDSLTAVGSVGATTVALGKNVALLSSDGTTWSRSAPSIDATSVVGVGGLGFIATGTKIWTSSNGSDWVENTAAVFAGRLNRVISTGGSKVLAVGADASGAALASMIYSYDGTNWTKATLDKTFVKELRGAAASPSLFVAVGDGGFVLTSTNGTLWAKRSAALAVGENFTDVAFTGALFVASTSNGAIWTSADGATWVKRLASVPGGLARVVKTEIGGTGMTVAVGGAGNTARSFGNVYWYSGSTITAQPLRDAVWTGDKLIAVGANGTILVSSGSMPPRSLVRFAVDRSPVNEAAGTATIAVQLTTPSPIPVTVSFAGSTSTVGSTTLATRGTTGGADYSLPTLATVTFNANESASKTIVATIRTDTVDEADETATITLSNPTGDAGLDVPFQHVLTIEDDDVKPFIPNPASQPQNQLVTVGSPLDLSATAAGAVMPTGVWKKNGGAIAAGAVVNNTLNGSATPPTTTFNSGYASAATTHAGAYTLLLTNTSGAQPSDVAQIGVVNNTAKNLVVIENSTTTLSVAAAGAGLSYHWQKGAVGGPQTPIDDDLTPAKHFTGARTPKLVIKGIAMNESNTYSCVVTQTTTTGTPQGTLTTVGGTITVNVINAKPVVTLPPLPTVNFKVGEAVQGLLPSSSSFPYKWAVTGIPAASGLKFDPTTGQITGRSLQPGSMTLVFTATNLLGASATQTLHLTFDYLPDGVAGTYMALGRPNLTLDKLLGSRIDLTIAANSTFSGKLWRGSAFTSFTGALNYVGPAANPTITGAVLVKPVGFAAVNLSFNVYGTGNAARPNTMVATISDSPGNTNIITAYGWRRDAWQTALPAPSDGSTNVVGLYNFGLLQIGSGNSGGGLSLVPDINLPQGYSTGSFTVLADGSLTMAGQLGDGTPFTSSGFLNATTVNSTGTTQAEGLMAVPIYAGLYGNTGAVDGSLTLTLQPTNYEYNSLSGNRSIEWTKAKQSSGVRYKDGFVNQATLVQKILTVSVASGSGRYTAPQGLELVMNLSSGNRADTANNLGLFFMDGGVAHFDLNATTNLLERTLDVAYDPGVLMQVEFPAVVTPPLVNNAKTSITFVDLAKGTFSGSFTLVDPDVTKFPPTPVTRNSSFSGLIVGHRGERVQGVNDPGIPLRGFGTFILGPMPYGIQRELAGSVQVYRNK